MENIIVAVVSGDGDYSKALSNALTCACRDISVQIYNNREFVRLWSDYNGPGAFYDGFNIILWAGEEVCESYSDNIVYMADNPSERKMDFEGSRFCLYRYESVRTLVGSIFEIYAFLTGRNTSHRTERNVNIIGFSSSCGGSGCTTLAMAVAQELVRFHRKRVIYISMEDVESTGGFVTGDAKSKNTGEYLYRLFDRDGEIPFLDSYLIRNAYGVEAFTPSRGKNPLRELKEEEMHRFIISLMECGRYDAVVADISTCLTDAGIATMDMADKIGFVSGSWCTAGREANYINQIRCCGTEGLLNKMARVENMSDIKSELEFKGDERCREGANAVTATVRRFKGNNADRMPDVLLEGGFGRDISRLTELMIQ